MILVVDNYDSFTYNLVHLLGRHTPDIRVVRNDALSVPAIAALAPTHILLSPGPGRPEDAGICLALIRALGPSTPVLGVCLGHQAIGLAYGATIVHAPTLMHGKTSLIRHDGAGVFRGLKGEFEAARYHSLVIAPASVPACLAVTATTPDGVIMGVRHREFPVEGIQFHPESILTRAGAGLITAWLAAERSIL
jgi:anthranilate synthase component 2